MHKIWNSLFNYNPENYWKKRGRDFHDEGIYLKEKYRNQEKELLNYLRGLKFESVLEIGCGYGRITKMLLENFEIKEYFAIDISDDLISEAKKLCKNFAVKFLVGDIRKLNLERKYGLVIGCEVLMHVPPEDIENTMRILVSYSQKHIINIDWHQKTNPRLKARHNFIHNYESIYNKIPEIVEIKVKPVIGMAPPSTIFHAIIG